jgi:hypothetical protein
MSLLITGSSPALHSQGRPALQGNQAHCVGMVFAHPSTRGVSLGDIGSTLVNRRHAATHVGLYRRTRHRSVGAKHATVARKGFEPFAAPFAVVEELASISRHRLDGLIAAFRASQDGLKLHFGSCFALSNAFSIGFYSGSRRITKRGPFQSSIDRSPTRNSAFSIASASSAQTRGSNPIRQPSRPTV